jgi:hypothetical protein
MGRKCSKNAEMINAYKILVGKSEGKRYLGLDGRKILKEI